MEKLKQHIMKTKKMKPLDYWSKLYEYSLKPNRIRAIRYFMGSYPINLLNNTNGEYHESGIVKK